MTFILTKSLQDGLGEIDNALTIKRAESQDIVPLGITNINSMPNWHQTDQEIANIISNGSGILQLKPYYFDLIPTERSTEDLFKMKTYYSDNLNEILAKSKILVVSGGSNEFIDYKKSQTAQDIINLLDLAEKNNITTKVLLCRSAHIMAVNKYNISIYPNKNKNGEIEKMLDVKEFNLTEAGKNHPLTRGFDDEMFIPRGRTYKLDPEEIRNHPNLTVLVEAADKSDIHLFVDDDGLIYMTGHVEYGKYNVLMEYLRDLKRYFEDSTKHPLPSLIDNYFSEKAFNYLKEHRDWVIKSVKSRENLPQNWKTLPLDFIKQEVRRKWNSVGDITFKNIIDLTYQVTGKEENKKYMINPSPRYMIDKNYQKKK
jgi:homoserine O-succinyltransferase